MPAQAASLAGNSCLNSNIKDIFATDEHFK